MKIQSDTPYPSKKKVVPIKQLIKKAQNIFNAWIRKRDQDKGCISCGGGVHNAGHYYHAHLYSGLRFNEINTNGQCIPCNLGKAGNSEGYKKGLIKRYGEEKVLQLENSASLRKVKKWSQLELEEIIKIYAE